MHAQILFQTLVDQALLVNDMLQDQIKRTRGPMKTDKHLRDYGIVKLSCGQRAGCNHWMVQRMERDAAVGGLAHKSAIGAMPPYSQARMYSEPSPKLRDYKLVVIDNMGLLYSDTQIRDIAVALGGKDSLVEQLLVLGG